MKGGNLTPGSQFVRCELKSRSWCWFRRWETLGLGIVMHNDRDRFRRQDEEKLLLDKEKGNPRQALPSGHCNSFIKFTVINHNL